MALSQKKAESKYFDDVPPDKVKSVSSKKYSKAPKQKSKITTDKAAHSSSSEEEEEEEAPVLDQLMVELGAKAPEPESELDDSEDEEEEEEEGEDEEGSELDDEMIDEEDDDEVTSGGEEEDNDVDPVQDEDDNDNHDDCVNTKNERKSKSNGEGDGTEPDMEDDANISDKEETSDEESSEDESPEEDKCLTENDPFVKHFEVEREFGHLSEINSLQWEKSQIKVPGLGKSTLSYINADMRSQVESNADLKELCVTSKLIGQVGVANTKHCNLESDGLTSHQLKLFRVLNSYQDLLFTKQTTARLEDTRLVYCLHALNHILKSRSRVKTHNIKINTNSSRKKDKDEEEVEYRDSGLTRPRVLILLPYRDRALKVVTMLITLLSGGRKVKISKRSEFMKQYSDMYASSLQKSKKPDDYKKNFEGNTDDNFKIGLSVNKEGVRLYSHFYRSDIILASPLGLREIIGLEGDKKRDFDFLSSIEVLIADQTDVFLMQNWEHFLHVMRHLHLQPHGDEFHNVDFSRVRMWAINGWGKFYRQTVMFTSVILPEIATVFNKMCFNFAGKILVHREPDKGTIQSCLYDSPQFFHRVSCSSPSGEEQRQAKMTYLKNKILPHYTSAGMKQTLIYCSYFSFVMLRNYFRETDTNFLYINEYDPLQKIKRKRKEFRRVQPHFLLYTERLHFHYRHKISKTQHILWFDLPQYPAFYPEIVNLMKSQHSCTSSVIFTRYEAQKLMEIVGCKQASHMLNSDKSVNMISVS